MNFLDALVRVTTASALLNKLDSSALKNLYFEEFFFHPNLSTFSSAQNPLISKINLKSKKKLSIGIPKPGI